MLSHKDRFATDVTTLDDAVRFVSNLSRNNKIRNSWKNTYLLQYHDKFTAPM
jgi:hypothetical protein